jgi:hypothetical protein
MSRPHRVVLWLALLALGGCTRPEEYAEVARQQRAALQKMADILAEVQSEKDLPRAKADLDERLGDFEAIARKGSALPKPPPPEAAARLEQEKYPLQRAVDRLREEVERVKRLPGGEEFFKQYQGRTSVF